MEYKWFDYGYHGSKATGTYLDCVVMNELFDGQLYVVTMDGECLTIDAWAFTPKGKIGIECLQQTPSVVDIALRLCEVCTVNGCL